LVTVEDFREITLRTPGVDIGRVEILPLFKPIGTDGDGKTDDAGSITVMIVPKHDIEQIEPPVPTKLFLQAVVDWLEPRRLVTTEVHVRGPVFQPIIVSLGIVTMPGQNLFIVQKNVKAAIRRYLSPLVGGPETSSIDGQKVGTGWSLRNILRTEDLSAAASRVEGVRYVKEALLGSIIDGKISSRSQITLTGIQLPWLSAVDVQEDTPTPVTNFANPEAVGDFKAGQPVPLLPRKC
jgi:hypothetical protein